MARVRSDALCTVRKSESRMSDDVDHFVTLAGITADGSTRLRLPDPPDVPHSELREQLLDGSYDRPFLVEDGERRALVFNIEGSVQSEMRLDDPAALVNEYTRKMMAFLLFCPNPRHVVMIGLGGGSLVKFCRRHLPGTLLTIVEIDATVIGCAGSSRCRRMMNCFVSFTPMAHDMSRTWRIRRSGPMSCSSMLMTAAGWRAR
jgi:hypothetical protein